MKRIFYFLLVCGTLFSCGTTRTVYFQCDQQDALIYVNNQLIGSGQGDYTTEPGENRITVSCRKDGVEVYSRDIELQKKSNYYEISIPKNLRYGSGEPLRSR